MYTLEEFEIKSFGNYTPRDKDVDNSIKYDDYKYENVAKDENVLKTILETINEMII